MRVPNGALPRRAAVWRPGAAWRPGEARRPGAAWRPGGTWRPGGAGAPARPDGGFTLVEVLVAMTVLAVGLVSITTVTSSSLDVSVRTSRRTNAVDIATQAIEATRAIPYDRITPASTTTTSTVQIKGTTYTLSQGIVWAASGTNTQAYKQAVANVRWSDHDGVHDVSQTTKIYPGGMTPSTTAPAHTTGCGALSAPTLVVAGVPLDFSGTTGVDITWTPPLVSAEPIAGWLVQWSSDSGTTWNTATSVVDSTVTTTRISGLSAGTSYQFRVASTSICSTLSAWSPLATATTLTDVQLQCVPGAVTVTPSAVKRASNSSSAGLETRPIVSLNTTGPCTGFTARYSPKAGDNRVVALVLSGAGSWSAGLAGATTAAWDVGQHPIDIYDWLGTKRGTAVLTVCEHNAKACS